MIRHRFLLLFVYSMMLAFTAPCAPPLHVVVSTSMLESAVHDIGLGAERISVTRLVPPGSCPGHFDVSPSIVPVLRHASVLVLHDYQKALATNIRQLTGKDLDIVFLDERGSLLIPQAYGSIVGKVAEVLVELLPAERTAIEAGRTRLQQALKDTEAAILKRTRAWQGTPVIASAQQKAFCEWLGFNVRGVLPRPENLSPAELTTLTRLNAALVVGNRQSDADAARVLAARMHLPAAVLSNFPAGDGQNSDYQSLLEENLKALEEAWHLRP